MDIREFILDNKLAIAVCIFLAFFFSIHMLKPSFVYNKDGSFREFGVGYRHKTVIPIWLVSIVGFYFSLVPVVFHIVFQWIETLFELQPIVLVIMEAYRSMHMPVLLAGSLVS